MSYSYVFQQAYVVAQEVPSLRQLARGEPEIGRAIRAWDGDPDLTPRENALRAVGSYLAHERPPELGFVTSHFSPAGGRMYFSEANAERIDASRAALHRWREREWIDDSIYYMLLAAIIEGADRVANTAGVYAAYIKSWQGNAKRRISILPELPVMGVRGSSAHRTDAVSLAADLGPIDLLYVDPPYNARQYPGYYHVPELIARGWFDEPVILRGKTGLLPADGQRSAWCSPRRVRPALAELLAATGAAHVLVSYNSEGLLPDTDLRAVLAEASVDGKVRRFSKSYRRYRADSEHAARRYKGSVVSELLYYARLR
jgi:adenine-specific DNA-methyltransferase